MKNLGLSIAILTTIAFTSCSQEEDTGIDYSKDAILISNEGSFQKSDASVTYFSRGTKSVAHHIITRENNTSVLGDVLQHMALQDNRLYMVLNNSGKVAVANATTLKLEGDITGLEMPRYFAASDNTKGYVTEWVSYSGNGRVAVVDLNTRTVLKTIPVGVLPEKLLVHNGKLYVVNQGGSTISVINTATDAVERTITVTHEPNSLVVDNNNVLWVLSNGNKNWQLNPSQYTAGALTKIDAATNTIMGTFPFAGNTIMANNLIINGQGTKLYYVYGNKVYALDITANALNPVALIDRGVYVERGFYGLGIDPIGGLIYAGKAPSFTDNGWVVRYNATSGAPLDSVEVGVAPNGFVFR